MDESVNFMLNSKRVLAIANFVINPGIPLTFEQLKNRQLKTFSWVFFQLWLKTSSLSGLQRRALSCTKQSHSLSVDHLANILRNPETRSGTLWMPQQALSSPFVSSLSNAFTAGVSQVATPLSAKDQSCSQQA